MLIDPVFTTAQLRQRESKIEAIAYQNRLKFLSITNWLSVLAPTLLSTFAGAAIIADTYSKTCTGSAALLSALLIAVHKGLNCDAYQAECLRLTQAYNSLATQYRTLQQFESDKAIEKLIELDNTLANIQQTTTAEIPNRYRNKATLLVDAKAETELS